jgi:23S rRNA-/tRNA-specific pseudouridylate synthase
VTDQVLIFEYTHPGKQRLDKYLVSVLPDFSRSRLQGLIKDGFVKINQKPATKGGIEMETGDEVEIRLPPPVPSKLVAENIPLDIVFENEQMSRLAWWYTQLPVMPPERWRRRRWATTQKWKGLGVSNALG